MQDALRNLISEFHRSSKLPIFLIDSTTRIEESFRSPATPEPPKSHLSQLTEVPPRKARIYTWNGNEYYSVIGTENADFPYIVLWVTPRTLEETGHYEDRFPTIGMERLASYTRILFFALFRSMPVIDVPTSITDTVFSSQAHPRTYYDQLDLPEIRHNSFAKETLLLDAVERGDLKSFNRRLSGLLLSGTYGQMATRNELRNKKNLALSATTLITRAAIRGGLKQDAAFKLSDRCCQQIEHMDSIENVSTLIQEIGSLFIVRIQAADKHPGFATIYRIKDYVASHLNGRILLDDMAAALGYSKNYLCARFRRETGMTIIYYANKEKIREAKSLLTFTNLPIAKIAESLGLTDQSYLTRLFIRFEKTTPRDYRKSYHV
ncbi:transcriptional regulator, AraC family [Coriobacterium glomerans PW2]|uniref:Transcriptional regulator, AraC family n=1 Tax=Coriobacterium glomerans (strain ATCC 49209 / DSM 20642 / JCM 10262 / PW2) TaxID=700015 RepID=F2N924_CORGP|nr:AraC family transcriptional regulator [Coriobacterium glomerans]AEB07700.1 transcriptional regulator, AraC family [Coriobacterium glomerans PW2]